MRNLNDFIDEQLEKNHLIVLDYLLKYLNMYEIPEEGLGFWCSVNPNMYSFERKMIDEYKPHASLETKYIILKNNNWDKYNGNLISFGMGSQDSKQKVYVDSKKLHESLNLLGYKNNFYFNNNSLIFINQKELQRTK